MQLGRLISTFSASGTQNTQANSASTTDPFALEMHVVENDEDLLRDFATGGAHRSSSSRRNHLHEPTNGPAAPAAPETHPAAFTRSASFQSHHHTHNSTSGGTVVVVPPSGIATATVVAAQAEEGNAASTSPSRPAAIVIAPRAAGANGNALDDDDEANTCGICLEVMHPSLIATLACCKNRLCFDDACRIGACPFCREEPLLWTLEGVEDDDALKLDADADRLVEKYLAAAAAPPPLAGDDDEDQDEARGRDGQTTAGFVLPSSGAAVVVNMPVSAGAPTSAAPAARGTDSVTSVFPTHHDAEDLSVGVPLVNLKPTAAVGSSSSALGSGRGVAPPTAFQSQVPVCMATPNSPAARAITPGGHHSHSGRIEMSLMATVTPPVPAAPSSSSATVAPPPPTPPRLAPGSRPHPLVPAAVGAAPSAHGVADGAGLSIDSTTPLFNAHIGGTGIAAAASGRSVPSVNVMSEAISATSSHSPMLTSPPANDVNPLSPAGVRYGRRGSGGGGAFGAHDPHFHGVANPSVAAANNAAGGGGRIVIPALRLETVAPATVQLARSDAPLTTSASPPLTGANPSAGQGAYVSAFTLPFAPNTHLTASGYDGSGSGNVGGIRPPPLGTVRSAASSTKFSPCPSSVNFNASNPTLVGPNGGSGGLETGSRLNTASPSGAASPIPLQQRLLATAMAAGAAGEQSSQQFMASGSVAGGAPASARFGALPTGMTSVALSARPQAQPQPHQQQPAPAGVSARALVSAPPVQADGPTTPSVLSIAPPSVTAAVTTTTTAGAPAGTRSAGLSSTAPPAARTITIPNRSSGSSSGFGLGIAVTPPRASQGAPALGATYAGPSSGLAGSPGAAAPGARAPLNPGGPGGAAPAAGSGVRLGGNAAAPVGSARLSGVRGVPAPAAAVPSPRRGAVAAASELTSARRRDTQAL